MKTGLLSDPRFLEHDTGPDHPERPDRLRAIVQAVHDSPVGRQLTPLKARPATLDEVLAVHAKDTSSGCTTCALRAGATSTCRIRRSAQPVTTSPCWPPAGCWPPATL